MSVVPQGKAIQAMYREYREGNLLVNRKYQRKLVWSIDEKKSLIDSILRGYPIPLILLAERPDVYGAGKYEIVDGIQRLNAIFGFIEQAFDIDGSYFDVTQFPTARQHAESGAFSILADVPLLLPKVCSRVLDYQLAQTIYPTQMESQITDLFGRINSGGRQLSSHEQRQAGVITSFSSVVRTVAAELRGDVSQDVLLLSQMPEISVESGRGPHGYGIRAEETLWCRQGILSIKQLKESEDEQLVADIAASIVLGQPLAASRELLDKLYDQTSAEGQDLERRTIAYGTERLRNEIKFTFSILKQTIEASSMDANYLRSTVRPGAGGQYPIKAPFYAIFIAFHDLVVREQKTPAGYAEIMGALRGLASRLQTGTHYETTENRIANIGVAKGLVQQYFVTKVPPAFGHGPSLVLDFENAVRRSRIESSRYEFKQGLLRLDATRQLDQNLLPRLVETACGISNVGPDADGNIFIGIADKQSDATRIAALDGISPHKIADHFVVGIDREAALLSLSLEDYVQMIIRGFQQSQLSEPLKTQVLGSFDTITIQGLSVVRILIPKQKEISYVGIKSFTRQLSSTIELLGQQLVAASKLFPI
jgi:hypothetical protein